MLTVEDCLQSLEDICSNGSGSLEITNQWDRRFISDVASHTQAGSAISTSQGTVVLKLIDRYRDHLVLSGINGTSIDILLQTPNYKMTPYPSTALPREVRWMGDNKLAFRFKFNAPIVDDIKRFKGVNYFARAQHPLFVRDYKIWIVDINSANLESIMDLIKRHRFTPDDKTVEYFFLASNAKGVKSSITVEDSHIVITACDDDLVNAWANLIHQLEL